MPHPPLRDHLRRLCLDEYDDESKGALYSQHYWWPHDTEVLADIVRCGLIAAWTYAEWPDATVVVKLPQTLALNGSQRASQPVTP